MFVDSFREGGVRIITIVICIKLLFSVQVTRLFKCGNHYVFGEDLEHRIADLKYSLGKSVFLENNK